MPKTQLTQKNDSSPQGQTSTSQSQATESAADSTSNLPTSRPLSPQEQAVLSGEDDGPYTRTREIDQVDLEDLDWDEPESWYYQDTLGRKNVEPQLRAQTRVYKIIGRNGKPTGRLAYAQNEVAAAALRQEVRDAKGTVYIPAVELVDVVYDDEK